jgi:hypothetical protein
MFNIIENISHIILITLLLIEGIKGIVHVREVRKKREVERKYSQKLIRMWKDSVESKISEVRTLGDLVNQDEGKEEIIKRIKSIHGELNDTLYTLILFSTDEPTEMIQAISYLNDRGDHMLNSFHDFLQLRVRDFKKEKMKEKSISKFQKRIQRK